jgi:hypothetical protein
MMDYIALAFTEDAVRAFAGFEDEEEAMSFLLSDMLPEEYVRYAVVPIEYVRPLDEEE